MSFSNEEERALLHLKTLFRISYGIPLEQHAEVLHLQTENVLRVMDKDSLVMCLFDFEKPKKTGPFQAQVAICSFIAQRPRLLSKNDKALMLVIIEAWKEQIELARGAGSDEVKNPNTQSVHLDYAIKSYLLSTTGVTSLSAALKTARTRHGDCARWLRTLQAVPVLFKFYSLEPTFVHVQAVHLLLQAQESQFVINDVYAGEFLQIMLPFVSYWSKKIEQKDRQTKAQSAGLCSMCAI